MAERRIVPQMVEAVVQRREHPAVAAALHQLVGLDRQPQAAPVGFRVQDSHARHAEHHGRARAAR